LLADYAMTAPHEPARARLREQLATGYLLVARHLARRYANRGEPLDDLEQVGCIGLDVLEPGARMAPVGPRTPDHAELVVRPPTPGDQRRR
jgi:hypothetical protein